MVEESQVVTRYAYVLFYRRRNSPVERLPRFPSHVGAESPTAAGATASQASLIWRELEEEDEGLDEGPRGLFRSALRRRQSQRNKAEEDRPDGSVRRHRRQKMSDYPDEDCASSQSMFGTELDPEGPPSLTPEVPSDLFAHSAECAAPSYSNMEEVD
ncbi:hypothetical protein ATANTOWER_027498 [Ataeniobius toweri]|uniref:Uncharacterized protein n=1 Tax=Ataeniobius toweri TaxID=208326 RepID=A0ABU7C4F4_9TELE|nr:hypothetical protein [Ataeniobius toweri]